MPSDRSTLGINEFKAHYFRVGVVVGPQAASSAEAAAANIVSPTVESTATIAGIDTRSTHE